MTPHWVTGTEQFAIHVLGMADFEPDGFFLQGSWLTYSFLTCIPFWKHVSPPYLELNDPVSLQHHVFGSGMCDYGIPRVGEVAWLYLQEESTVFPGVVSYPCFCQERCDQILIPSRGSPFNSYFQSSCGNGQMRVKAWVQTSDIHKLEKTVGHLLPGFLASLGYDWPILPYMIFLTFYFIYF